MSFPKIFTWLKSVLNKNSRAIRNVTISLIVFVVDMVIESEDLFQCSPRYFAFYELLLQTILKGLHVLLIQELHSLFNKMSKLYS